jgi:hypothetical protein
MVAPTCFGITLPSSGSFSSAFWEMLNWGAVDRILWMGVLCLVMWCVPCTLSSLVTRSQSTPLMKTLKMRSDSTSADIIANSWIDTVSLGEQFVIFTRNTVWFKRWTQCAVGTHRGVSPSFWITLYSAFVF